MANTKNYTEHGGSVTHIGGELVLDPGSKVIKDGQEIEIGGGAGAFIVTATGTLDVETGSLSNITIDKTIDEIASAAETGIVVCRIAGTVEGVATLYGFANLAEYIYAEGYGYTFVFYRRLWETQEGTENIKKISLFIAENGDETTITGTMDAVVA